MASTMTAIQMLDREFLTIRSRLIDVAAALDRIDRAPATAEGQADSRYVKLMEAAKLLADHSTDKAERMQLLFSDAYDEAWRAWMPRPSL